MATQLELHEKGQKNKNMLLNITDIDHIYEIGVCCISKKEYSKEFCESILYTSGIEDKIWNEVINYDPEFYRKICFQDCILPSFTIGLQDAKVSDPKTRIIKWDVNFAFVKVCMFV